MTNTSRFARPAAALAALVIAASASAQGAASTITPEVGISWLSGKWISHNPDTSGGHGIGPNIALGWQHSSGFGVRALFFQDFDPYRNLFREQDKSFNDFLGVQATGSLPLSASWNLKGGVGLGRTSLDQGPDDSARSVTDGALSVGLQWRPGRHYAMELRVDHLTRSDVTSAGLLFQWPF